jgi:hypothetical protein
LIHLFVLCFVAFWFRRLVFFLCVSVLCGRRRRTGVPQRARKLTPQSTSKPDVYYLLLVKGLAFVLRGAAAAAAYPGF